VPLDALVGRCAEVRDWLDADHPHALHFSAWRTKTQHASCGTLDVNRQNVSEFSLFRLA
jgi:hypothetical protein